jgi:hypothetical protein
VAPIQTAIPTFEAASTEVTTGPFVVRLVVAQPAVAGRPIEMGAVLTYLGPLDTVLIFSSGAGPFRASFRQVDGPLEITGLGPGDCGPFFLERGRPYWLPYRKSGGYSPDEPFADFYEAFFSRPELALPAGAWVVEGRFFAYIGACGGPEHEATLSLPIAVGDE